MSTARADPGGESSKPEAWSTTFAVACFSVPELADAEARLITAADRSSRPTIDSDLIETALGRFPHLSVEQADMVRSVCLATTLLRLVVGLPGSGKTSAAAALVAACQAAAVPVVGCAVTATAADELGRRTGLATYNTLARTLSDSRRPGDSRRAPWCWPRALLEAAGALLEAAGALHGPAWTTSGGREFQAGRRVVGPPRKFSSTRAAATIDRTSSWPCRRVRRLVSRGQSNEASLQVADSVPRVNLELGTTGGAVDGENLAPPVSEVDGG